MDENCLINSLEDLLFTLKENKKLKIEIEQLKIEKAKYKAYFQDETDLGKKLNNQLKENKDILMGVFDGFADSSIKSKSKFRTLEDMLNDKIITKPEYNYCIS